MLKILLRQIEIICHSLANMNKKISVEKALWSSNKHLIYGKVISSLQCMADIDDWFHYCVHLAPVKLNGRVCISFYLR